MKKNFVILMSLLCLAAFASRIRPAAEASPASVYSFSGISLHMSSEQVKEQLGMREIKKQGFLFFCTACDTDPWSDINCSEHSSTKADSPNVSNFGISLDSGKVVSLSPPALYKDGVPTLKVDDSLSHVKKVLGDLAIVEHHDEVNTVVTLPSDGLILELNSGRITNINYIAQAR